APTRPSRPGPVRPDISTRPVRREKRREKKGPTVTGDRPDEVSSVRLALVHLPLAAPISDAKVLTGRQRPLTKVAVLMADITTAGGHHGFGFSYSKRAGGDGLYAHASEIAPDLRSEERRVGAEWR